MQTRSYADKATPTEVSSILEQRIRGVQEESGLAETGRVLSVGYVELEIHGGRGGLAATPASREAVRHKKKAIEKGNRLTEL